MESYIVNVPIKRRNSYKILNIMIISTSKDIIDPVRKILKQRGHNVEVSSDCLNCVKLFVYKKYDIIFTDMERDHIRIAQSIKKMSEEIYLFAIKKTTQKELLFNSTINKLLYYFESDKKNNIKKSKIFNSPINSKDVEYLCL